MDKLTSLYRTIPILIGVLSFAAFCSGQQLDTTTLLETAVNGSGMEQYAAIDDLGQTHVDAAAVVPALQKLLESSDPQVRWRSARALGDYEASAQNAVPVLRDQLGDENAAVQYHAVVALARIGDTSDATVRGLLTAATSEDERVARVAISSLRHLQIKPAQIEEVLHRALASDDQAVVVHAMEAVVEHGAEAAPILIEALSRPDTVYLACAAIEHIGPDAAATVPALTELLGETKHSHLLIQALLALASIGPAAHSAAPKITPLLEFETDATVPVAAAYALGAIGAVEADADLRAALGKSDPFLQMVAAWSLAKLHPGDTQLKGQAIEKLQAGLNSEDPLMRTAAERGLTLLNPPLEQEEP